MNNFEHNCTSLPLLCMCTKVKCLSNIQNPLLKRKVLCGKKICYTNFTDIETFVLHNTA